MSQNDFIIANQTFPNFRVDLNDALQALASSSSGSVAPTTTYAYMLWYDTTNDILKMRTSADDGWINLMNFDQGADTATASLVEVDNSNSLSSDSATVPPSTRATRQYISDEVGPWTELAAQATTSGTAFDETGLPTSTSEVEIFFSDVSLNSGEQILVQIGGSTLVTSGYESGASRPGAANVTSTGGFVVVVNNNSLGFSGSMSVKKFPGSNEWVSNYAGAVFNDRATVGGGRVTLGTSLQRVRVTRTGTGNFDSGKIFVRYRG